MKSLVFNAKVGTRVAIRVSTTIPNGVTIPNIKFVPPGCYSSSSTGALLARIGSPFENINSFVLHVNEELEEQNRTLNSVD